MARRKKAGEDAAALLAGLKASGEAVKALDVEVREVDAALEAALLDVPNFLPPDVPDGDVTHNRVVRTWGEPRASTSRRSRTGSSARRSASSTSRRARW